jgi:hypothetical protein
MFQEILEPVAKLSKFLQKDDVTLGDAYLRIESTIDNIDTYGAE